MTSLSLLDLGILFNLRSMGKLFYANTFLTSPRMTLACLYKSAGYNLYVQIFYDRSRPI